MNFYITETPSLQSTREGYVCAAHSLNEAMQYADDEQVFQGTVLKIVGCDSSDLLAYREAGESWVVVDEAA